MVPFTLSFLLSQTALWLPQLLHTQAFSTSFLSSRRRRKQHQHRRFYHGKLYFNNSTAVAVAEGRSFSFVSDPTIRYPRCFVFFSSLLLLFLLFCGVEGHDDEGETSNTRNKDTNKHGNLYHHKNCKETRKCWALFFVSSSTNSLFVFFFCDM
jgi:hypothetical protein